MSASPSFKTQGRKLLLSCVLMLCCGTVAVHAQAGRVPAQLPARADTSKIDLRVTAQSFATQRNSLAGDGVASASGSLRGVEGWLRGADLGIYARYMGGSLGGTDHSLLDARFFVGDPRTMLEAGWLQRTRPAAPDSMASFVRLGLRVLLPIGSSGAVVYMGGGGYVPLSGVDASSGKRDTGWDGESGIRYRLTRWDLPLELQIGYRAEYMRSRGNEDEMGSVIIGAGFNFIGR